MSFSADKNSPRSSYYRVTYYIFHRLGDYSNWSLSLPPTHPSHSLRRPLESHNGPGLYDQRICLVPEYVRPITKKRRTPSRPRVFRETPANNFSTGRTTSRPPRGKHLQKYVPITPDNSATPSLRAGSSSRWSSNFRIGTLSLRTWRRCE